MSRIIQGRDRPVEIDEARQTVTKTYLNCSHETAVQQIEREVSYASRLSTAFSQIEGLSCPSIIGWDLRSPPRVVMSLCPGVVLLRFLKHTQRQGIVFDEIANRIHHGIEIYINLFGEPCYDFGFHNMLYDESSRVLTLLDFGLLARIDDIHQHPPLEASLGNLVGCACYDLVRPTSLLARKRGCLYTMRAVLATFGAEACKCRIRAAALSTIKRLTEAGGVSRRKYYNTIGACMVRRHFDYLGLHPSTAARTNSGDFRNGT